MKIRAQKLGEQVLRILGRRIVQSDGEARLPSEQEICAEFSVSRTVAREVISTLESLNVVRVSQGRRMVVRAREAWDYMNPLLIELHSPDDVRRVLADLHEVRLLIEPEIAAEAARQRTTEHLEKMKRAIEAMERSLDDPDEYLEHDVAFHTQLAHACGNIVLRRIVQSSRGLLSASRRVTNLIPGGLPIATQHHRNIYEAVVADDSDAARRAMIEHLEFATKVWIDESFPIELGASEPASPSNPPEVEETST